MCRLEIGLYLDFVGTGLGLFRIGLEDVKMLLSMSSKGLVDNEISYAAYSAV